MEERTAPTTYKLGQRVTATVERVLPFGVFARLPGGTEAYVRRREVSHDSALLPEEWVSVGQKIEAVVVDLPRSGQNLELSIRQAEADPWETFTRSSRLRDTVTGTVKNLSMQGVWVQIIPGVDGFIPPTELAPWPLQEPGEMLWIGDRIQAMITGLDPQNRRVRLSIRRQLIHEAHVRGITDQLFPDEPWIESGDISDELDPQPGDPVSLQGLGKVLVVDDDDSIRDGLVSWLQRHDCPADGVGQCHEGLEQASQAEYHLVIADLDLAGSDGLELIRCLKQVQPDTPVIVMSIPQWIAERSQELENEGVVEVFPKPLDLDEVAETLARLARGEKVGPFRMHGPARVEETKNAFQQLAHTMRSGISLQARLEAALKELRSLTRAELVALFHLDSNSQKIDVVAQTGSLVIKPEAMYGLAQSPVRDLILRGGEIHQIRMGKQARPRFSKLLEAVDFESCVGVPVLALGRVDHALFMFHREPDTFSRYRLRDAHATATLLGVALESQALEERIRSISPSLISGQLAAGFGHDVFNKMTGLELQVRNLRAACRAQTAAVEPVNPVDDPSCLQAVQDMDQLLDTTLDLKQTVGAFQELMRAETQASLDVNQVATRSGSLLRSIAQRSKVQIEWDLSPDLPLTVGSSLRLQQAFLNMMLNAIQHTALKREQWPKGASRLRITTGLESGPGRVIWVRFADTGPGIHHAQWDAIFALGFSTRPGGSGLGLFIARSLIESMGGTVAVEQSTIPTGTTFRLELPIG